MAATALDDFERRLGITRHVLADRLKKLVTEGILEKVAYQTNPPRFEYRLTEAGLDLYPVLMGLVRWGDKYRTGDEGPPMLHRHTTCGHTFAPVTTCSVCGETLDPHCVRVVANAKA